MTATIRTPESSVTPRMSVKGTPQRLAGGAGKRGARRGDPAAFLAREGQPLRSGLDTRVSTRDLQTFVLRVEAMRAYVGDRGWGAVEPVADVGAGAEERPGREAPLETGRHAIGARRIKGGVYRTDT